MPETSFSDELSIYTSSIGAGDSWTIGSANTGVAIDSGAVGVDRNPAALLINRNEILGEGAIAGGISMQHKVSSDYTFGPGSFYYQTAAKWGNFALYYTPRNRANSNAEYESNKVLLRDENIEIGSTIALKLIKDFSTAFSIATIRGKSIDGVELKGIENFTASSDTIYEPYLWTTKFGIQKRKGRLRWGAVLELPAIGELKRKNPTNQNDVYISNKYDYYGAMGLRVGVGKIYDHGSVESDIQYYNCGMVKVDNHSVTTNDHLMSIGITGQLNINQQIKINSGLRFRLIDPEEQTSILFGIGAKYILSEEVTFIGGAGMLFYNGDSVKDSALEDIRPWTLRGGVVFYGK